MNFILLGSVLAMLFGSAVLIISKADAQTHLAEQDFADYLKSKHSSKKWDTYVKEGFTAFQEQNYDVALNHLFKAFNLGCQSPIVLFQLALLNEYQKSYYSALEFYRMAQKGFTGANTGHRYNQSFFENYGRALYDSGRVDEALPVLQKAAKNSTSFWLFKLLGMIAYQKGDTLNATAYFERAVRQPSAEITNDELVYIYTLLGRLFLQKGETDGATRYYSLVTQIDPNNPEANRFIKGIQKNVYDKKLMEKMEGILRD